MAPAPASKVATWKPRNFWADAKSRSLTRASNTNVSKVSLSEFSIMMLKRASKVSWRNWRAPERKGQRAVGTPRNAARGQAGKQRWKEVKQRPQNGWEQGNFLSAYTSVSCYQSHWILEVLKIPNPTFNEPVRLPDVLTARHWASDHPLNTHSFHLLLPGTGLGAERAAVSIWPKLCSPQAYILTGK